MRPLTRVGVATVVAGGGPPQHVLSGQVRARIETTLAFKSAGKVVARFADVGDHVAAGALLARLDAKQAQADVEVATAAARSAEIAARKAQLDQQRERELFAHDASSQAALEAAEAQLRFADSACAAAQAALGMAREALADSELRASRAGTITAREIEVGLLARPGVPAFVLADDGPRDAELQVEEGLAQQLAGQMIEISLADAAQVRTTGRVREIAPRVDAATASVTIKVALDGAPPGLTLGAPVVGQLSLASAPTLSLPAAAITTDRGQPAVWVIDRASHKVSLRRIDVAAYAAQHVVVRAGLRAGELVVTNGANRLRPAQIVGFEQGDSV